jgi:hypothetical protein
VTESLARIQDNAVAALKRWLNGPEDRKTENLRTTAACFVSAREHFLTPAGDPDWLGRSHAYRHWVRETMSYAGIPADRTSGTLTSIRYHAGNALRERLDASQLEALGLLSTSPLKRAQDQNAGKSKILQVLDGARLDDGEDAAHALQLVTSVLRRIDLPSLDSLDDEAVRSAVKVQAHAAYVLAAAIERVAAGEARPAELAEVIELPTLDSE